MGKHGNRVRGQKSGQKSGLEEGPEEGVRGGGKLDRLSVGPEHETVGLTDPVQVC